MQLDEALAQCPVAAILRGVRPDEILATAEALYDAGLRVVEIPLNSPEPLESLRRLAQAFGEALVCGSGTVLSMDQVDQVAQAGGRLVVAPNTSPAVIRRALDLDLDPVPGFATATEAFQALEAGARRLKLFPAITYGPAHLRQLKAVLPPETMVWAVGGVTPDTFEAWTTAGARAFGLGSDLYRPGQSAAETRDKAMAAVAAVRRLTFG